MDRLDCMRLFIRVVERGSFTAAAADLGIPRSTATEALKGLEAHLGARLLDRTTRHVAPTMDGQDYYRRCLSILGDLDEAESMLRDTQPRGLLRVDAHVLMTRTFLLPRLPEFLDRYPKIDLHLGQGDRRVDLVREGVDCVIRSGEPGNSGMIGRRLGTLEEVTVASPDYLARHGVPDSPDALQGHQVVGFVSSRTGEVLPLELMTGQTLREIRLPSRVSVNNSDTMADLARMGFGLVQAPRYRFVDDLASGRLVEVLSDHPPSPTPLFALYPQNRQLAPRLRVFLDWLVTVFKEADL
ncbi:LysR family transcriptional regulator [Tianweitania sp. BSSL-BM11]|uniref:LysR family transcriptional regulator n=1 Tax=Tianweitania aestuarii TaxID=2814886 RepID=A0ABS5RY72_9HYPH|nr:LysR family transcriptional regulator [Tianweitania aestuarii]MBS9721963.1 LysR family transcriptional regulator [Tianweitania aestuarii]